MDKIETGIWRLQDGRLYMRTTARHSYTGEMREREATLEAGATLADARSWIRSTKSELREERARSSQAQTTLTDYVRSWLVRRMNSQRPLSPATAQTYVRALEHLCSAMGQVEVSSIRRPDVLRYSAHLGAMRRPDGSTYATDTLRSWWRPALSVLREAVADGYIPRDLDPTYMVEPPLGGPPVREAGTLSGVELSALLSATLLSCHWRRYPEVVTLAYTGMRPGELYALQWDDVDFTAERLHIRRTVSAGKVRETTKTGAARDTYLAEPIARALHWQRGEVARLGRSGDLVFPSRRSTPRHRGAILTPLAEAGEIAGIAQAVTPQVLRRTFDTLLVSAGVDRIVLRSMIGHTTEEMTERYAGVRHEDKRAAVLRLVQGT